MLTLLRTLIMIVFGIVLCESLLLVVLLLCRLGLVVVVIIAIVVYVSVEYTCSARPPCRVWSKYIQFVLQVFYLNITTCATTFYN